MCEREIDPPEELCCHRCGEPLTEDEEAALNYFNSTPICAGCEYAEEQAWENAREEGRL